MTFLFLSLVLFIFTSTFQNIWNFKTLFWFRYCITWPAYRLSFLPFYLVSRIIVTVLIKIQSTLISSEAIILKIFKYYLFLLFFVMNQLFCLICWEFWKIDVFLTIIEWHNVPLSCLIVERRLLDNELDLIVCEKHFYDWTVFVNLRLLLTDCIE